METLPQVVEQPSALMPAMSLSQALTRYQAFKDFYKSILRDGMDYGTVPGTGKPTLLKPGAEKLTTFFGLSVEFEIVEKIQDWTGKDHGEPFFYYLCRCHLHKNGTTVASADGSCNSWESKYRYRWVYEHDVPHGLNPDTLKKRGGKATEFTFAVEQGKTDGDYGKPEEYWQAFRDGIEDGTAVAGTKTTRKGKEFKCWTVDMTRYRIPNEDVTSQVNTILKMAQKRAFVAATLIATNASEFFTQDVEDYIEGEIVRESPANGNQKTPPPPPAPMPPVPQVTVTESSVLWALKHKSAKGTPYWKAGETLDDCRALWQKIVDNRDKINGKDLEAAVILLHEDAEQWVARLRDSLEADLHAEQEALDLQREGRGSD